MTGPTITYQGVPCIDVRFRRAPGDTPDSSIVRMFVEDFSKLEIVSPPEPEAVITDPEEIPDKLNWNGTLKLQEFVPTVHEGEPLEISGLFVSGVSKARSTEPTGVVDVTLVDERVLWDRGTLDVWEWNVRDSRGEILPGTQRFLSEIARDMVAALPGKPRLTQFPLLWTSLEPEIRLPPHTLARDGLRELRRRYPHRICLQLNRTVGLWLDGEGPPEISYSGSSLPEAAINNIPVPLNQVEDAGGEGDSRGVVLTNTPESVTVVGSPIVASVAIDCWEPVVETPDGYQSLDTYLVEVLRAAPLRALRGALSHRVPIPTVRGFDDAGALIVASKRDNLIALLKGAASLHPTISQAVALVIQRLEEELTVEVRLAW